MVEILEIADLKEKLDKMGIEEILKSEVTKYGTSAKVGVSKKHIGKNAIIIILKR
jgi:putative transposon-encoded protein